ncbi:hypothetical protein PCE1_003238 [Barthelona sp. PCE]
MDLGMQITLMTFGFIFLVFFFVFFMIRKSMAFTMQSFAHPNTSLNANLMADSIVTSTMNSIRAATSRANATNFSAPSNPETYDPNSDAATQPPLSSNPSIKISTGSSSSSKPYNPMTDPNNPANPNSIRNPHHHANPHNMNSAHNIAMRNHHAQINRMNNHHAQMNRNMHNPIHSHHHPHNPHNPFRR